MRTTKPIALLSASLLILVLVACSQKEPLPEPVRAVQTMKVADGAAVGKREYAGEVRARVESRLGFRVSGKVLRRLVDLGDTVHAGQVLAQMDPQDYKLSSDAAKAALVAAQSNLKVTAADYERFKSLRAQGFISSAELEHRDTALKAAQAQYDQAKAQADVQGHQTNYAALVADADGVITGVDVEPGMVVSAGMPVMRLAHDGPRDVVFSVPEDRLAEVKSAAGKHLDVKVRIWGGDVDLPARVREVAAAADPVTRTFLVKADVGKAGVKLGQTAAVRVDLPRVHGVIRLPLTAVTELRGASTVWVLDEKTMQVQPQPIQVAGADGNTVVVSGGLKPGQVVVTAGVHVLTPGLKVKLYQPPTASMAPVHPLPATK